MAKFDVGDQVRLKSNGPAMTVRSVLQPSIVAVEDEERQVSYRCQWFAGAKLNEGVFPEDSLEPVNEKPKDKGRRK